MTITIVILKSISFTKKDISFVTYFTNVSIRHRGQIEKIIKNYIKKNPPKNVYEIKAGLILGLLKFFLKYLLMPLLIVQSIYLKIK